MKIEGIGGGSAVAWAWALALAAVTLAGSLATSCMMPFVAVAAIAAATLPRDQAFAAAGAAWAVEQALGFGLLGYPADAHAIGWGLAIGAATLAAVQVARFVEADRNIVRAALAFALGFVAYEAALYAYGLSVGGTEAFTASIVAAIGRNEAMWFVALVVIRQSLRLLLPERLVPRAAAA